MQDGIKSWREEGSCHCASCRGDHTPISLGDMLRNAVCKPTPNSYRVPLCDLYQPIRYVPNYNCVVGDCQKCGWYHVELRCLDLRDSDLEVTHDVFTSVDVPTKGGKFFRKTMSQLQTITRRNLCVNVKEGLHSLLEHHYQNVWISRTTEGLFSKPPLGWVGIRWDSP